MKLCLVLFCGALASASGLKINDMTAQFEELDSNFSSTPHVLYIGHLDDTTKHPYIYATRKDANDACKASGFQGLCTKAQINGYQRCAAGWLWDFKGYWMKTPRKGCGSKPGYQTWGKGKVGAYCCHPKAEVGYIGSLTDPSAHPYVYASRADGETACKKAGYQGLCAKKQITGFSNCAAGWTSDWKGYWFERTKQGCGEGTGFRRWSQAGKVGAYCCGSASSSGAKYIGSLADPSAHPYVYATRAEGLDGCKTAGYKRLCHKYEIEGASKCAAGWLADFKGYWFHKTANGCGQGKGFRNWKSGKVGAYCCQPETEESVPLCKGSLLAKKVGVDHWQCDTLSGSDDTAQAKCAGSYDTDGNGEIHMQCGVHMTHKKTAQDFNCLASTRCRIL